MVRNPLSVRSEVPSVLRVAAQSFEEATTAVQKLRQDLRTQTVVVETGSEALSAVVHRARSGDLSPQDLGPALDKAPRGSSFCRTARFVRKLCRVAETSPIQVRYLAIGNNTKIQAESDRHLCLHGK